MSLLTKASTVTTPTAYSEGLLHSVKPVESLGSEEVTNGRFATDSDWTKVGNVTIQNGIAAFVDNGTNANSYIEQNVLTASKNYKVIIEVTRYVAGRIQIVAGSNTYNLNISSGTGVYKLYVESGSGTIFRIKRNGSYANFNFDIDNVSVKEVLENADFDFARASSATRVNEQGYIEKERENLLLQSNQFNTTWSASDVSVTSGQSGYDGNNAWLLNITGGTSSQRLEQSITNSGIQTFSIYVKAGTLNWVRLRTDGSTTRNVYFNLQNGVIGTTSAIDAKIQDVGSGWFRCSLVTDDVTRVRIYPADADGDITHTSGNIYIQDAQLEQGLVATDYIETTTSSVAAGITNDIPRINYEGGIGNFLLEPSRTNSVVHSEYFGGWSLINVAVTSNSIISPDGTLNGSKLIASSGTSNKVISQAITANTYTASVFAKKGEFEGLVLATGTTGAFFNLNTHSFRANYTSAPTSYKIEDYGNGWHRYSITFTQSGSNALYIGPNDNVSATLAITGDGSKGIYTYGAQLEASSYPTSYIPTYGSTVTRVGETCNNAGISHLINSTEGVLYVETRNVLSGYDSNIYLTDGTNSERVGILFSNSSGNLMFLIRVNEVYIASITISANQINWEQTNKIAIKYKTNDMSFWLNGTKVATDTSGTMFSPNTLTQLGFNSGSGGTFYGETKMVSTFKEALSDSELECLTSWSSFNRMATAQNYNIE